jgi:hypothetical protein
LRIDAKYEEVRMIHSKDMKPYDGRERKCFVIQPDTTQPTGFLDIRQQPSDNKSNALNKGCNLGSPKPGYNGTYNDLEQIEADPKDGRFYNCIVDQNIEKSARELGGRMKERFGVKRQH